MVDPWMPPPTPYAVALKGDSKTTKGEGVWGCDTQPLRMMITTLDLK